MEIMFFVYAGLLVFIIVMITFIKSLFTKLQAPAADWTEEIESLKKRVEKLEEYISKMEK
ncbi:MAG TPA: hypothetical protein VK029_08335 [Pseudogracilibacillus sp.]|nr:hypothetical protein [Pseudogracilibacillus sp.]